MRKPFICAVCGWVLDSKGRPVLNDDTDAFIYSAIMRHAFQHCFPNDDDFAAVLERSFNALFPEKP